MTKGDKIKVRLKDGSGSFNVTVDNLAVCRDCQAPVAWCETPKKKKMPVEVDPAGDGIYEVHFPRCPGKVEGGAAPAAAAPSKSPRKPSIEDRVKALEEAVFGSVQVPRESGGPMADDSLPF